MKSDQKFLKAMGIAPCAIIPPIPHEWMEADCRTATATSSELNAERELSDKRAELIENLSRTIEALELREKALDRAFWIACIAGATGWGIVVLFVWKMVG
jgi:hypothetical protein